MGDKMKLFHREHKIENHEEKEMFFSFCVEQIYPHKQGELFVLGTVDGKIQEQESMYLIGPYGFEERIEVNQWIEVDPQNNFYALLVDQKLSGIIDEGYIFTNKNNHLANSREDVFNPFFLFLLEKLILKLFDFLVFFLFLASFF